MKKLLAIVVLGFLFSCSEDSSNNDKILMGAKVYSNICSGCHDSENAPNLTANTLKLSEIVYKVTYGGYSMPSFENTLSEKEIENVAYYIYRQK